MATHGSAVAQYPEDHQVDRPIVDCSSVVACC